MRSRVFHLLAGILIAGMAMISPAPAAEFEITPFIGYTGGGDFNETQTGRSLSFDDTSSYGIMLDFKQTGGQQEGSSWIELYLSRQQTKLRSDQGAFTSMPLFDVNIEYYHLGGTYSPSKGKVEPFVAGTLGVTHMSPKQGGYDSETRFSLSLGGGARFYLTKRVGLRLDARWFGTLFNGSGGIFCANGACLVQVQGDVLSQFTANAGVILAF